MIYLWHVHAVLISLTFYEITPLLDYIPLTPFTLGIGTSIHGPTITPFYLSTTKNLTFFKANYSNHLVSSLP